MECNSNEKKPARVPCGDPNWAHADSGSASTDSMVAPSVTFTSWVRHLQMCKLATT